MSEEPERNLSNQQHASAQVRQQGDVLTLDPPVSVNLPGHPTNHCIELSTIALVSQTCDIVSDPSRRPYIKIAPVKIDPNSAGNARNDKSPQFGYLPGYDKDGVVCLDQIVTVCKTLLDDHEGPVVRGCSSDSELRKLQRAIARHFRRFAFPDELEPAIRPLKKHWDVNRKQGPEATALEGLVQVRARVEDRDWASSSLNVELVFLVGEQLHMVDEDLPEPQSVIEAREFCVGQKPRAIAERLAAEADVFARVPLWDGLVDAWVSLTEPDGRIGSLVGRVFDLDTFSARDLMESDQLELEHLSRTLMQ